MWAWLNWMTQFKVFHRCQQELLGGFTSKLTLFVVFSLTPQWWLVGGRYYLLTTWSSPLGSSQLRNCFSLCQASKSVWKEAQNRSLSFGGTNLSIFTAIAFYSLGTSHRFNPSYKEKKCTKMWGTGGCYLPLMWTEEGRYSQVFICSL
jgi:hypothetical protein